jgi:peptidoglycan biosynthesis protein MviN/MurJ (putative lipid II flippase)
MAAALWWFTGDLAQWLAAHPVDRALHLVAGVSLGIAVYAAALFASGMRPADLSRR